MSVRSRLALALIALVPVPVIVQVLISTSFAADNILLWAEQMSGAANSDEVVRSISTDNGIFVVGTTTGHLEGETNAGGIDGWIRKYNRYGTVEWSHQFGTSGDDIPYGVDGNTTHGLFIVGSTTGAFPNETNAGGIDIFAQKYETDGTYDWTNQIGTSGTDELFDVDVYDTMAAQVVGRTNGDISGTNAGGFDMLGGYITNDGDFGLSQLGTSGDDAATAVTIYSTGTPYVSGYTTGAFSGFTNAGGRDAFLMKIHSYDPLPEWVQQFGSSGDDEANGVALNDASVIVGGSTTGTLPGKTSAGGTDAFAASFDADGTNQWTTQFGTSGDDTVKAAAGTAFLPMSYVVGQTTGAFSGQNNAGQADIFAARFDVNGNRIWTTQYGSNQDDLPVSAALDFDLQHFFAVGSTDGKLPDAQNNFGGTDGFIIKFAQDNEDDGIFNDVDILPYDYSDYFLDDTTSVPTRGRIVDRGNMLLKVYDSGNSSRGVVAHAKAHGQGSDPGDVEFCDGAGDSQLDDGDSVEVTCGSVTIGVLTGVVDSTFQSPEGLTSTTTYDAGNALKYDPTESTFVAPAENADDILVNIGATDQLIGPGQTIKLVPLIADSFLREGHPNQNEGANPMLILRKQGSTHPLISFDLSGISLTGLTKATLVVTIGSTPPAQWGSTGRYIEVRRVTQAWTEGNGKDIDVPEADSTRGTGAGTTWNCGSDSDISDTHQDCATEWSGGAFAARTAPTVKITNGMTGEISFDVTQDVLNGATNGWLIKKVNDDENGVVRFYSREGASGDPSLAPKLLLQYE